MHQGNSNFFFFLDLCSSFIKGEAHGYLLGGIQVKGTASAKDQRWECVWPLEELEVGQEGTGTNSSVAGQSSTRP